MDRETRKTQMHFGPRRSTVLLIVSIFGAMTPTAAPAQTRPSTSPKQATTTSSPPVRTASSFDDVVILHRGARMMAPEGTIPAFEAARRTGADGIEVDLRATLDGVCVNYHDAVTVIVGRGFLPVEWMTLEELRELDVGVWFHERFVGTRVPTFEDVLRFAVGNDLKLRIDIKDAGLGPRIEELMTRYEAWPLFVSSRWENWRDRECVRHPWIAGGDLWRQPVDHDPWRLAEIVARQKTSFRTNVEDARIVGDVLGRSATNRRLEPSVVARPAPPTKMFSKAETLSVLRTSESPRIARIAAYFLVTRYRGAALAEFGRLLESPGSSESSTSSASAQAAAWGLGFLESAASVTSLLVGALHHRDADVRTLAAYSIGRRPTKEAVIALRRRLASETVARPKAAAIWALARAGDRASIEVIARSFTDGLRSPSDSEQAKITIHAALALGRLDAAEAIPDLARATTNGHRVVSTCALHALADLGAAGHEAAVHVLRDRLLDADFARPMIVASVLAVGLARCGVRGRAALCEALATSEPTIAREVVFALARGGPAVVTDVARIVGDASRSDVVRRRAVIVLRLLDLPATFDWNALRKRASGAVAEAVDWAAQVHGQTSSWPRRLDPDRIRTRRERL